MIKNPKHKFRAFSLFESVNMLKKSCPEKQLCLHFWRLPKHNWTKSRVSYSSWPCSEHGDWNNWSQPEPFCYFWYCGDLHALVLIQGQTRPQYGQNMALHSLHLSHCYCYQKEFCGFILFIYFFLCEEPWSWMLKGQKFQGSWKKNCKCTHELLYCNIPVGSCN